MKTSKAVYGLLLASLISACGKQDIENADTFYNTGSPIFEMQTSYLNVEDIKVGNEYFVTASALRVRATPEINNVNILGELKRNEKVLVIEQAEGQFVKIEILNSDSDIDESESYYTSAAYLSDKKSAIKSPTYSENKLSEYFMVQNMATEKIRVYKRGCESGDCAHTLLMETDAAVGEDDKRTISVLGHFHIKSWHKFYQDGAGHYPSWYDPNYPAVPRPGADPMDWFDSDVMPYSDASMRGAFGWYTAKVGPDAAYQWTHGTIGWGSDKKTYIEATRGFWANLFADPRSSGCTRTDNESIAYIRQLLPVGSTLIKVYAREGYADPSLSKYQNLEEKTWEYILTKNGVRRDGQLSDKEMVLQSRTPASDYIEEGRYKVDQIPTAEAFIATSTGARTSKNGNYYKLKQEDVTGVYLVDEGRLLKYKHPTKKLRVGGYKTVKFPKGIMAPDSQAYTMAECPAKYLPLNKQDYRRVDSRRKRLAGRCAPFLDRNGNFFYKGR